MSVEIVLKACCNRNSKAAHALVATRKTTASDNINKGSVQCAGAGSRRSIGDAPAVQHHNHGGGGATVHTLGRGQTLALALAREVPGNPAKRTPPRIGQGAQAMGGTRQRAREMHHQWTHKRPCGRAWTRRQAHPTLLTPSPAKRYSEQRCEQSTNTWSGLVGGEWRAEASAPLTRRGFLSASSPPCHTHPQMSGDDTTGRGRGGGQNPHTKK